MLKYIDPQTLCLTLNEMSGSPVVSKGKELEEYFLTTSAMRSERL